MCAGPMAVAMFAVNAASAYSEHKGAEAQYKAQVQYRDAIAAQDDIYRRQIIDYQNKTFGQDLDYQKELLAYQQKEFKRQEEYVAEAREAVETNYLGQVATLLQRQVEESIAAAFGVQTVQSQARAERAKNEVIAGERGIEGNTVDAVVGDIMRQGGEALSAMELQQDALDRQFALEAMGLKASADQALNNIVVSTFQPLAPIAPPSPVAPVQPGPPIARPNPATPLLKTLGAAGQSYQSYRSWTATEDKPLSTVRNAFKLS